MACKLLFPCGFFLAITLCGCGPDGPTLRPVEGKVSYNGTNLKNGSVVFIPLGNLPSAVGIIDASGVYKMSTRINGVDREGAAIGDHKVMIVSIQETGDKLPEDRSPLPPPNIPTKFGDTEQSGLTAKVEDKKNAIDFHLK